MNINVAKFTLCSGYACHRYQINGPSLDRIILISTKIYFNRFLELQEASIYRIGRINEWILDAGASIITPHMCDMN